ncbi:MAG TPA: hypothetical protein VJ861_07525 [Treponemataceae bacterium]|nr:hypothetical protein [Treponemataceae bacterium]
MKVKVILYSIMALICAGIFYLVLPVVNFMFYGLPLFVLIIGLIILIIEAELKSRTLLPGIIISILGAFFLFILPFFTTPQLGRSQKYRALIGTVVESDFSQDITPIDINKIRLVDQSMASKLGEKTIGQDPALGSSSFVGEFNIQKYKGELYWVAPLLHRSFFKWLSNKEGAKGYIMVSATNPQEIRLVQNKGRIKYQKNAFFKQDLKRHIYTHGFITRSFTDYTFEIDDNGKPYWVLSEFKKTIGYSGKDIVGTIIVDADTGEINSYTIEETPLWVDRIQPEDFIIRQINDWGKYNKGFWNSVFAEEGVLQLTPGVSLVYGDDGSSNWYSGISSSGSDESTIGFTLINTRTKNAKFYKQSGATETAAMSSAEGKVQEKEYRATFPIMYNILGKPTYILTLKDKGGLIKMIAMVSVEDYTLLGIGDDTEEALRNYKVALMGKFANADIQEGLDIVRLTGIVERINSDIMKGTSFYYLRLKNFSKTFTMTSQISKEIILTLPGDTIEIGYENTESDLVEINSFTLK